MLIKYFNTQFVLALLVDGESVTQREVLTVAATDVLLRRGTLSGR